MCIKRRIKLIKLIINGIYIAGFQDGIYAFKLALYNKYQIVINDNIFEEVTDFTYL
jgi:hypothetical protein